MPAMRNTEFSLHVFKRRTDGQRGDRFTIGVWEGIGLRAICHDACLTSALVALRHEIEDAGQPLEEPRFVDKHFHVVPTHPSNGPAGKNGGSHHHHPADALREMVDMGDAPACNVCGAICTRSGACFRGLTCGQTTGCG
jgi:hypothetical protein